MAIAHTHLQQPAPRSLQAAPAFCDPANRKWILAAAILASAMGFIDGSVIAIALPAMRASLGADLAQATWINNAYLLPLSALILVGGAAGDRFGVARVFMAGIALFVLASLAVALAPDPATMIAARAVKGVAAAAMVPGSLAIIARAYPRAERGGAIIARAYPRAERGGAIGLWAAASSCAPSPRGGSPRLRRGSKRPATVCWTRLGPADGDLLAAYCRPVPVLTIARLLGVPEGDASDLLRWSTPRR